MACLLKMLEDVTSFSADLPILAAHLQRSPEAVGRRLSRMGWSSPHHRHRRGRP